MSAIPRLDPFQRIVNATFGLAPLVLATERGRIFEIIGPLETFLSETGCFGESYVIPQGGFKWGCFAEDMPDLLDCRQAEFYVELKTAVFDEVQAWINANPGVRPYWGGKEHPFRDQSNCYTQFPCWYPYPGGFAQTRINFDGVNRWLLQLHAGNIYNAPWVPNIGLNTCDVYWRDTPQIPVTSIVSHASGITITAEDHRAENGRFIELSGTVNYNGRYTASNVTANTMVLDATYVDDETSGKMQQVYTL